MARRTFRVNWLAFLAASCAALWGNAQDSYAPRPAPYAFQPGYAPAPNAEAALWSQGRSVANGPTSPRPAEELWYRPGAVAPQYAAAQQSTVAPPGNAPPAQPPSQPPVDLQVDGYTPYTGPATAQMANGWPGPPLPGSPSMGGPVSAQTTPGPQAAYPGNPQRMANLPVAPYGTPSIAAPPAPAANYGTTANSYGAAPNDQYAPAQTYAAPPNNAYGPSPGYSPAPYDSYEPAPNYGQSPNSQSPNNGYEPVPNYGPAPGYEPVPQQPANPPVQPAPSGAPETPPSNKEAEGELFEAGKVVAVVGDEPILAGDVLGVVTQVLEANKDKIPAGKEHLYRDRFMEQFLEGEIQNKLIYLDFLRTLRSKGAGPEKVSEIHNRVFAQFDEKRLPEMMEKAKVTSPADLDAKMRQQGTSLMKHKRQFAEKVMSQQWLRETEAIDHNPIITHGQMLDYYYAHGDEYAFPAKAKWEHLMARFDKFPDKASAWEAVRAMGNEVYLGGAPLWAVAKRSSQGVTASNGGQFDWTTQGSLKSKVLDKAIFELPLQKLSPILEDEEGYHIVRVLERTEAGRTSFESAQAEIKEALRKEQVNKQITAYLADLRKKTPVWTVFDEDKKQRQQDEAKRQSEFGTSTR